MGERVTFRKALRPCSEPSEQVEALEKGGATWKAGAGGSEQIVGNRSKWEDSPERGGLAGGVGC
jgi:hypothetical protein